MRRLILALFMSLPVPSVAGDTPAPDVFALYSNLCYNDESTDLTGERIGIFTQVEAAYVLYQEARGIDVTAPRVIKLGKGALSGSRLKFSLTEDESILALVSDDALDGEFYVRGKPNGFKFHLNRMRAPEKFFTTCK